ncbi:uncharacterized protein [Rutidosis leptorrhynchoides]|uniref:uncharacterized protein n=1 Tax=Rutidosis leptorrhynchoides TaxID=125765 RepID=UPI003A9A22B7
MAKGAAGQNMEAMMKATRADDAKNWLESLPEGEIDSWTTMEDKFLQLFFPASKAAKLQSDINYFVQKPHETLYDAWTRTETSDELASVKAQLATFKRQMESMTKEMHAIKVPNEEELKDESSKDSESKAQEQKENDPPDIITKPPLKVYKAPIPYPKALKKDKLANQYKKFLDMINQISINMPLAKVIRLMPNYGKFLKDLIFSKGKYQEVSATFLNEACSAILQKQKLPPKLGDPGSFIIPCLLGDSVVYDALADLGASVNLMPYSLYLKLGLEDLKPTRMGIRLANHSFDTSIGIAEDLIVRVSHPCPNKEPLVFPTDFVVLELKEDTKVPIILGRPFLNIADAIIHVQHNQLSIGVGDERVICHVDKAIKQPKSTDDNTCFQLDVIDLCVEHDLQELLEIDTAGFVPMDGSNNFDLDAEFEYLMKVDADDESSDEEDHTEEEPIEEIKEEDKFRIKTSLEEPPILELKKLPEHLEYAYLQGIEVDQAKLEVISKLPEPSNVKAIRSFLGHTGFYRRFIKDFSKIARPMTKLLEKDTPFDFNGDYKKAFFILKTKLTQAPIIVSLDFSLPFELMCDASDYALGAISGQRHDNHFRPIYYAIRMLTGAQINYTTTEKELFAVVFAFDKFRPYLVLSKTIVYTNHSALKYLFAKQDAKQHLISWVILLQEFDIEIRDKKGPENLAADHLSRLKNPIWKR